MTTRRAADHLAAQGARHIFGVPAAARGAPPACQPPIPHQPPKPLASRPGAVVFAWSEDMPYDAVDLLAVPVRIGAAGYLPAPDALGEQGERIAATERPVAVVRARG